MSPFRAWCCTLIAVLAIIGLCPASAATATTTSTRQAVKLEPKAIVAAVRSAAYSPATRVAAKVGTPSCPTAIKTAVGLTFQCLVAFDTTPVAFLVTIGTGGTLDVRPTFPVVSLASARLLAGANATCGAAKAKFVVLPIGATIACTQGTGSSIRTVTLRVIDQFGALQPVP